SHLAVSRTDKQATWKTVVRFFLASPAIFLGVARRFAALAWRERRDFISARGKVGKISYFVHNFMDSKSLDKERCDACSFLVLTPEGPISMCVHNAKRDDYLLVAARVKHENRMMYFNPATGKFEDRMPDRIAITLTRKNARGRAKVGVADAPTATDSRDDLLREAAE
ncbi:MAG: hypothetical protein ABL931_03315, partial [Usitatibacteraceae bacterium]